MHERTGTDWSGPGKGGCEGKGKGMEGLAGHSNIQSANDAWRHGVRENLIGLGYLDTYLSCDEKCNGQI